MTIYPQNSGQCTRGHLAFSRKGKKTWIYFEDWTAHSVLQSRTGDLPAQMGRPAEAATALLHQTSSFWPKYSREKSQTQTGQQVSRKGLSGKTYPQVPFRRHRKKLNAENEESAVPRELLQQGKLRAGFSGSWLWTKVPKFCANFTSGICLDLALNLPLFLWRTAILPWCFTVSPLNSPIPLQDLGVEGPPQKSFYFITKSKVKRTSNNRVSLKALRGYTEM